MENQLIQLPAEVAEKKAKNAPDRAKIENFANELMDIKFPDVKSDEAKEILSNVDILINKVVTYMNSKLVDL